MLLVINGHRVDLKFVSRGIDADSDGYCQKQPDGRFRIRVRRDLPPSRLFEVTLHELLHAARWDMKEHDVTRIAFDISTALISLNFVNVTEPCPTKSEPSAND